MTNWQEIARCFATLRPSAWIDAKVSAYLSSLSGDWKLLVGCSGGADSVFLTLAMLSVVPNSRERLMVAHFNHGLRGAESDADELFVQELAARLGLQFQSGRAEEGLNPDEASLRDARYSWFKTVYESNSAAGLVLGHHGDDLLESLLLGILSGAGPSGLASPMPVRRFADGHVRLRPLLAISREKITRTLESLGAPWREDDSNADPAYTRNWLRSEILPHLARRIPQDIFSAGRRSRQLQEECVEALDLRLVELGLQIEEPRRLALHRLCGQPAALVRRAIGAWWMRHLAELEMPKGIVDPLVEAVSAGLDNPAGQHFSLPRKEGEAGTRYLRLDHDWGLYLETERPSDDMIWAAGGHWPGWCGTLYLPDGAILRGNRCIPGEGDSRYRRANPQEEAWLAGVSGPLQVKQWQPGDRYQPLGAPGSRKLQDLFVDAKLSVEQKRRLPVITDANGAILWIPGFPPADKYRICQPGISALQLTYTTHSTGFRHNHGG